MNAEAAIVSTAFSIDLTEEADAKTIHSAKSAPRTSVQQKSLKESKKGVDDRSMQQRRKELKAAELARKRDAPTEGDDDIDTRFAQDSSRSRVDEGQARTPDDSVEDQSGVASVPQVAPATLPGTQ